MTTESQLVARRQWIADLRSGQFTQNTGALCRIDSDGNSIGYCCLGVALIREWAAYPDTVDVNHYRGAKGYVDPGYFPEYSLLPRGIQGKLGLRTDCPEVRFPNGRIVNLTVLNDEEGATFHEIADLIEAQGDDWDGVIARPGLVQAPPSDWEEVGGAFA